MDIGIDLGTANIMISMGSKGVILYEPSVVAFNKKTEEIIAVGSEAYRMIGKAPDHIAVIRPLCDGVISDYDMTESMLMEFIHRVTGKQMLMPRIVMCVPSLVTDVESRAVIDAARRAGAQKVYLIEEPVAALLGAGVDISKAKGNMVVDIGGGTTDIAVISMNGIVAKDSIKLAGDKLDLAIMKYVQAKYRIMIGEKTAENAKISLANVFDPDGSREMIVKGRNLVTGLPAKLKLCDYDIYKALIDPIGELVDAVKGVLERTPPELSGDLCTNGIILTGGGALLRGLDKLLSSQTHIPARVADDPLRCVAMGSSKAFNMLDTLLDGFQRISLYKFSEQQD
ncbi:MAG: rod shape-determining protein [Huintestinicola sp.]